MASESPAEQEPQKDDRHRLDPTPPPPPRALLCSLGSGPGLSLLHAAGGPSSGGAALWPQRFLHRSDLTRTESHRKHSSWVTPVLEGRTCVFGEAVRPRSRGRAPGARDPNPGSETDHV